MPTIYFATKNQGKVATIAHTLMEFGIEVEQVSLDLPEPRSDDVKDIAREKVLFAYTAIKKPCIAIDAGFYIHSLNGFPRAFVNFALETINLEGMLRLVEGRLRDCRFHDCIAYMDDSMLTPIYFERFIPGTVSYAIKGELQPYHWSSLSRIFIPEGESKTLAEMSREEFFKWKAGHEVDSSSKRFGEWFCSRQI